MYAKVFTQIYDSSIADDWKVRVVFEDFLILSDADGVVDMTQEAISARTRIPLEIILHAIERLESPDTKSRTPDHDGRRIIRLNDHRNWGWRIVNYTHYRNIRNKFDRKEYMRNYMRENRPSRSKVKQEVRQSLTLVNQVKLSPSPSSSTSFSGNRGAGEGAKVPWQWVLKWIESVSKTGADYTEAEAKQAWLALEANGWMWGKNPVTDWRSALECRIQEGRLRNPAKVNGKHLSGLSEYGTAAQSEARRKAEMEEIARLSKGSK